MCECVIAGNIDYVKSFLGVGGGGGGGLPAD